MRETVLKVLLPRWLRVEIRERAKASWSQHITILPSSTQYPTLTGEGYGWTTRTGIPIHSPKAYAKVGWSSMVYNPSTIELSVGMEWIAARLVQTDEVPL